MARVWIEDLWIKEFCERKQPDGTIVREVISTAARNSLAACMKAPEKAKVPDRFKTARYGEGKRWRVSWWGTEAGGSRKRRSRAFAAKVDAESYAAAMEDDIRSGRYVNPADGNRVFRDVAIEWLSSKNNLRDRSYVRYEHEMNWYVLPQWGNRAISSITEADINEWIGTLAAGTAPHEFSRKKTMQPLKAKTIKSIVKDTFGGVLGYAASPKRRWIAADPLDGIRLPQDKLIDDRVYLTNQQVNEIAEAAGAVDKRNSLVSKTLVLFLAYTGLRANEALALCVGDLDFRTMRVKVTKTITTDRQGRETEGKPKSGKSRTVPIPRFLLSDLRQIVNGRGDDEYFFTASKGGMIHLNTWRSRVWYKAKESAGYGNMEGLRIHSLRHTYASLAIAAGCDVKTLQAVMGHASATETLNTYAALWPDRLDDVTSAIESNYEKWRSDETA